MERQVEIFNDLEYWRTIQTIKSRQASRRPSAHDNRNGRRSSRRAKSSDERSSYDPPHTGRRTTYYSRSDTGSFSDSDRYLRSGSAKEKMDLLDQQQRKYEDERGE